MGNCSCIHNTPELEKIFQEDKKMNLDEIITQIKTPSEIGRGFRWDKSITSDSPCAACRSKHGNTPGDLREAGTAPGWAGRTRRR